MAAATKTPAEKTPNRDLGRAGDEGYRDTQAGDEATEQHAAESVAVHALDPPIDLAHVERRASPRSGAPHREAPAPREKYGTRVPVVDAAAQVRITRASSIGSSRERLARRRDDQISPGAEGDARLFDRVIKVSVMNWWAATTAEHPRDELLEERAQGYRPFHDERALVYEKGQRPQHRG